MSVSVGMQVLLWGDYWMESATVLICLLEIMSDIEWIVNMSVNRIVGG